MNWQDRITVDQNVCHGTPCIRGTRVMVSAILDKIAVRESVDAIARAYKLTRNDVRAAELYNDQLLKEKTHL